MVEAEVEQCVCEVLLQVWAIVIGDAPVDSDRLLKIREGVRAEAEVTPTHEGRCKVGFKLNAASGDEHSTSVDGGVEGDNRFVVPL